MPGNKPRPSEGILNNKGVVCLTAFGLVFLLHLLFAQDTGLVVGTVINSTSGVGVAGMNVLLWIPGGPQYQATTDDTGTFRIEDVSPGSYRSRFEGEGFVPFQHDRNPIVVASATEPVRVRIEMSPYAMVRVRVQQGPMLPSVRRPCASSAI
jgi:hypothetical protein